MFRIGHLGALDEPQVLSALAGAEMALADCGVDLELGSGVAAAQAWFPSCGADKLNSAA